MPISFRARLLKFATVPGVVKQYRRALEALQQPLRNAEGRLEHSSLQPTAKEMFTKSENLFHGTKNVDAVMADRGLLRPKVFDRVFYGAGIPEEQYLGGARQEGFIIPKAGVPSARHPTDDPALIRRLESQGGAREIVAQPWALSEETSLPRNTTAVLDTITRGKQAVQDFRRKNKMRVIDSRVLADAYGQIEHRAAPRPATREGLVARYRAYDPSYTLGQVERQIERRKPVL